MYLFIYQKFSESNFFLIVSNPKKTFQKPKTPEFYAIFPLYWRCFSDLISALIRSYPLSLESSLDHSQLHQLGFFEPRVGIFEKVLKTCLDKAQLFEASAKVIMITGDKKSIWSHCSSVSARVVMSTWMGSSRCSQPGFPRRRVSFVSSFVQPEGFQKINNLKDKIWKFKKKIFKKFKKKNLKIWKFPLIIFFLIAQFQVKNIFYVSKNSIIPILIYTSMKSTEEVNQKKKNNKNNSRKNWSKKVVFWLKFFKIKTSVFNIDFRYSDFFKINFYQ